MFIISDDDYHYDYFICGIIKLLAICSCHPRYLQLIIPSCMYNCSCDSRSAGNFTWICLWLLEGKQRHHRLLQLPPFSSAFRAMLRHLYGSDGTKFNQRSILEEKKIRWKEELPYLCRRCSGVRPSSERPLLAPAFFAAFSRANSRWLPPEKRVRKKHNMNNNNMKIWR